MSLQEMPEKSENEIEEPTESQGGLEESPITVSDEELSSDDSAPVDDSQSPESVPDELEVADQTSLEVDPVHEQGPSSELAPVESELEDVNTSDEATPDADIAPEKETSSSGDPEGSAWYVIHCYSGYENKVRHNLEQRIETMGMKDKIFDVVIPTQEEIEVKDGKRRTVERYIFPGYVLVNLALSEESWYVVRNTPGVTGFVGMGNTPTALRPEEVSQIIKRMEADAPTVKVTYKVGERVRIVDGPFNDFRGIVAEIDMERTKVRVNVSFFGRETPVELDFLQVEKA